MQEDEKEEMLLVFNNLIKSKRHVNVWTLIQTFLKYFENYLGRGRKILLNPATRDTNFVF